MIDATQSLLPAAFGLGQTEMILIVFVVLLLFGAKRIPELGRSIGSGMRNLKKGIQEGDDEEEEEARQKALTAEKTETTDASSINQNTKRSAS